jgi:DNA-binding NtrC family response regulator
LNHARFRRDLYYRLNVFPIRLLPLRERREDIPLLCEHFLRRFAGRMKKTVPAFTPEALEVLMRYDWPGNVRELSNVVERIVIVSEGEILDADKIAFLMDIRDENAVPKTLEELNSIKRRLREAAIEKVERAFLLEALAANDHNATRAAAAVGMQRMNFQTLLRKYNLRIRDLAAGR